MIEEVSQRTELYREFERLGIPTLALGPLPDAALQELLQAIKKAISMTEKDGQDQAGWSTPA